MQCLDESRNNDFASALHLLSLEELIQVQEVTGKKTVSKRYSGVGREKGRIGGSRRDNEISCCKSSAVFL